MNVVGRTALSSFKRMREREREVEVEIESVERGQKRRKKKTKKGQKMSFGASLWI